jgi:hypothetical protein
MNLEQAKAILKENGKPTCPCKYENSFSKMIEEAIKIQERKNLA